jgi:hypothetical protein
MQKLQFAFCVVKCARMLKEEAYIASTVISNCRVARGRDALVGPDPLDVVIEDGRIVRIVAAGEGHGKKPSMAPAACLCPE